MKKLDEVIKLKKFDKIIGVYGDTLTVNYLKLMKGSKLCVIHYMNGARTYCLTDDMVAFERGFKPVCHKVYTTDINEFYLR